jgi:small nuclear ribonucleoprotein (snRNP)-like protein
MRMIAIYRFTASALVDGLRFTPEPVDRLLRSKEEIVHTRRKFAVSGLAVCVAALSWPDLAISRETATPPNPTLMKEQIDQLGVGAKVKVRLASGEKLSGAIEAIEERAFLLASARDASPRRVAYDQIAGVKLARLTYRASRQSDPTEAKRVVAGLGVGRHIMVKTAAGQELHGNIQAIESTHFTVLPDHQSAIVQIAYSDITQLGPNLSRGKKIAIIAIAAGVIAIVIIAVSLAQVD